MSEVVIQRGDGLHLIIQRGVPGAPGKDGVSADWGTLPNKPAVIAAGDTAQEARDAIGLGTVATHAHNEYATAAQGGKADTALQPNAGLAAIDSAANILLNTIAKQYFVEVFRQPGDTDSQVIKKALAAIEADNKPAVLRFESGRTYTYDSSHSLGMINDLAIDCAGAYFVRANASVNSATLSKDLPTSGSGSALLELTEIPLSWEVGDLICACIGDGDNGISNVRRITTINRTTKKVTINAPLDGYTGASIYTDGTTILKSWGLFVGRPSATDSTSLLPAGANVRIRIYGGKVNGNSSNQLNRSWRCSTEVMLHSEGGLIADMDFRNTSNECLVGHGFTVQGCTFVDLGGSALHTSVNDQTAAVVTPCMVYGNTFRRTNLFGQAKSGHAEGAITFSWGAGNLIIQGNFFDGGNEAILGGFGPSSGANADIFFTFSGNICKGYQKIFNALLSPIGVTITGNTFHDCGDNTSIGGAFTGNANKFTGNAASGNTVLPNIPSAPITSATQFTALSGGASEPATPLSSTALRAVYVSPADIGGTSLGSHQVVAESSVVARIALASGTNGDGTIAFFNKNQSTFGSAFISYAPGAATFNFSTNIATGNHNFKTALGQSHLQLHADGSTVHVRRTGLVYFGDKNTDGSWAIDASGNDLVFKRLESGSWVTKSTIAA